MTTPRRYSATATVRFDPPKPDPDRDDAALRALLADRLGADLLTSSLDQHGRRLSLVLAIQDQAPLAGVLRALAIRVHQALDIAANDTTAELAGLEVLDAEEVNDRLAARGVPRPGHVPPAAPGAARALAAVPNVVDVDGMAEILELSPSRVRHLRAERRAADAAGTEHPFPAEYFPFQDYWLEVDAQDYRDHGRRAPGRPARTETTDQ